MPGRTVNGCTSPIRPRRSFAAPIDCPSQSRGMWFVYQRVWRRLSLLRLRRGCGRLAVGAAVGAAATAPYYYPLFPVVLPTTLLPDPLWTAIHGGHDNLP